ncbi:hypothetical protein PpBr36_02710 [Pyricularia pennisetigena]|uniref:hypothetical protein n=1 Tax=Pyricularia pennisetigena TaxID=1578925 RepID=UPI001151A168|nr:hypothetical protein PpBr36_02710 [Pyricularia pennisetigena]TLS30548.1 hypothetical protein PpBr36_02710 [Pyricularia pennisetigena]
MGGEMSWHEAEVVEFPVGVSMSDISTRVSIVRHRRHRFGFDLLVLGARGAVEPLDEAVGVGNRALLEVEKARLDRAPEEVGPQEHEVASPARGGEAHRLEWDAGLAAFLVQRDALCADEDCRVGGVDHLVDGDEVRDVEPEAEPFADDLLLAVAEQRGLVARHGGPPALFAFEVPLIDAPHGGRGRYRRVQARVEQLAQLRHGRGRRLG